MKTIAATFAVLVAVCAATFAQQSPVQPLPRQIADYTLGPGDEFQISITSGGVLQGDYAGQKYTVSVTGEVILPNLQAPVKVGGHTIEDAKAMLKALLIENKLFADPQVTITVTAYRSMSLTVQGAVRTAGQQQLQADRMSLPDAINQAGGLTPAAGSRILITPGPTRPKPEPEVQIEDGKEVYRVSDLMDGRLADVRLYPEDMVVVEVAPRFFVNGYVKAGGDFAWAPGMNLRKAIALAGGLSPEGAANRISIERKQKDGSYKKINLAKDKMSTAIEPDDVVNVPKKWM